MAKSLTISAVDIHQLAAIVKNRIDNALILDSRSFLEYNASHISNAINVGCAKLMKRRLQQEKLCIEDFLAQSCHWNVDRSIDIIVYDQNTRDVNHLSPDSFMSVFLQKLLPVYNSVNILKGGFLEFQATYPNLCEEERSKYAPLTSLSQPCLPISNHGPTRILPFLYLGSQQDALNKEVLQHHNITYQLNVSTSCPKPDFIQESYFMRIPVIDNYSEKLLPYFPRAFQFLDKVKESSGCVLVHCLAGVSRSATVAIAYVMKSLKMTSDEAYRFVKGKRSAISPNFNFLGQLLEYEKHLQREHILKSNNEPSTAPPFNTSSPTYDHTYQTNSSTSCYSTKLKERSFSLNCYKNLHETVTSSSNYEASHVEEHITIYKQNSPKLTFVCIPKQQPTAINVKYHPVSSLKELNFTPCQTALKLTQSAKHEDVLPKDQSKRNPDIQIKIVDDESNNIVSPLLSDLKAFEFNSKSYNRTDSVSTSGLGSEESDYSDSWNEFTSSCERESDILMDDDYSTVPMGNDSLSRNKNSSFEDSYDDSLSLYPKCELPYNGLSHQVSRDTCWNAKKCNLTYEETTKYSSHQPPPISDEIGGGGAHFLYRAQSCPGMLSSDSDSNHSQTNSSVRLRKHKPSNSNRDKTKNRYSCSSIDYMDYSLTVGLSHESCPDVLQGSDNQKISSHCNYRHSMIEVS